MLLRLKVTVLALCCAMAFDAAAANAETRAGQSQQLQAGEVPQGLAPAEWSNILGQIQTRRHHVHAQGDGNFASANLTNGWDIEYQADGTTILGPADGVYYIGLKLTGLGYKDLKSLSAPVQINSDKNTVTYQWDQHVREIWTNSDVALEQWFVLDQRPASNSANQHLTLEMALDTSLAVSQQGNGLRFSNAEGIDISYNKLKVWDSTGRGLPAQMALEEKALKLVVDDTKAIYPLTIDPSFQLQAYLKASNTGAGDHFGTSVAVSGDTVVVGAPRESSSTSGVNSTPNDARDSAGAAYVFSRSGETWTQQAWSESRRVTMRRISA